MSFWRSFSSGTGSRSRMNQSGLHHRMRSYTVSENNARLLSSHSGCSLSVICIAFVAYTFSQKITRSVLKISGDSSWRISLGGIVIGTFLILIRSNIDTWLIKSTPFQENTFETKPANTFTHPPCRYITKNNPYMINWPWDTEDMPVQSNWHFCHFLSSFASHPSLLFFFSSKRVLYINLIKICDHNKKLEVV